MRDKPKFSKVGLIKASLFPALITFLIPGFGLWFFTHVEFHYDQMMREAVIAQIQRDNSLTQDQRLKATSFYKRAVVSKILASNNPKAKSLQDSFQGVHTRYAIFRWMKRISAVCLIAGAGAFVAAGLGVLFSLRSQNALYWSLRLGWNILRWFAVIEVLGQGVLAIALSFWVTAFWTEKYYVKLIIVAAIFALCAVLLLMKAIFRKLPAFAQFDGRILGQDAAPELWQRVRQMAERLGTAPPENIFVGIDDNFFVTEHPVKVGTECYTGRTLFMSLSLLKTMSRSEADSVLAHELAHFSGEDTIYSKRISPLLGKYAHYLEALHQGGISRPIFHFMFLFWNAYQFALNKLRREREFRADRIGSELTSPHDIARSLVKITTYCRYREKVQRELFGKNHNVETMDVFQRIENGFPGFMSACASGTELAEADTPHPFDSHPPLARRLENVGVEATSMLKGNDPLPALADSWFSAIAGAAAIEAEQWKAFEESFHKAHQENLAWRFKPEGEAEISHVLKYFPELQFGSPKGITAILDYEKLVVSDWDAPLFFSMITSCRLDESLGGHKLVLDYFVGEKKQSRKVSYKDLQHTEANFLQVFQKYYSRHLTAMKYQNKTSSVSAVQET